MYTPVSLELYQAFCCWFSEELFLQFFITIHATNSEWDVNAWASFLLHTATVDTNNKLLFDSVQQMYEGVPTKTTMRGKLKQLKIKRLCLPFISVSLIPLVVSCDGLWREEIWCLSFVAEWTMQQFLFRHSLFKITKLPNSEIEFLTFYFLKKITKSLYLAFSYCNL